MSLFAFAPTGVRGGLDYLKYSGTKEAGRYTRDIAGLKAELVRQAMESETEQAHERARELKAEQRVAFAKSGAMISSGTPLLVMVEQAGKMEKDIMNQRRNRMIEAQGIIQQGRMAKWEADQKATADLISSITGSVMQGASMVAGGMAGGAGSAGVEGTGGGSTILAMNTRNQNYNILGGGYYA